ncbi:hypothetical protein HYS54_03755 [Candidatus Micrarchaeota archaeon]|nr:hypothetical protein [Candidatus Micrarchaeota archaeon]
MSYKVLGMLVLSVFLASIVLAEHTPLHAGSDTSADRLGKPTDKDKTDIRGIMKQHFASAINGHGIAITADGTSYAITKFHLVKVRHVPAAQVREILRSARQNGKTWDDVKSEVRSKIANAQVSDRGRIDVNGETYLLSGIARSEDRTWSADIMEKPDVAACRVSNKTLEECESASAKVGSVSLTFDKVIGANRVYKGTLMFEGVTYNNVALVHGRGGAS